MSTASDITLGMVGDEWHGPTPPGPDWVQVRTGKHGGKVWKKQGGAAPAQAAPAGPKPSFTQAELDALPEQGRRQLADRLGLSPKLKGRGLYENLLIRAQPAAPPESGPARPPVTAPPPPPPPNPVAGQHVPLPRAQLTEHVARDAEELLRTEYAGGEGVPIHVLRRRVAERYGAASAAHAALDEAIKDLWRDHGWHLIETGDPSAHYTPEQLRDSIIVQNPGEERTHDFVLLHPPRAALSLEKARASWYATLFQRALAEAGDVAEALLAADLALSIRPEPDVFLGMVGDEWHGPTPPGPDWVQVRTGAHGGKVWKKQGGQAPAQAPEAPAGPRAPQAESPYAALLADERFTAAAQAAGITPQQLAALQQHLGGAAPTPQVPAAPRRPKYEVEKEATANDPVVQGNRRAIGDVMSAISHPEVSFQALTQVVQNLGRHLTPEQAVGLARHLGIADTLPSKPKALQAIERKLHGLKENSDRVALVVGDRPLDPEAEAAGLAALRKFTGGQLSLDVLMAHDVADPRVQRLLDAALGAARRLSDLARRELRALIGDPDPLSLTGRLTGWVATYRLALANLLGRAQLAALLAGASEVAQRLPPIPATGGPAAPPETLPPAAPWTPPLPGPGDPARPVFPAIEEAVRSLAERDLVTPDVYERLDAASRAKALTVARVDTRETLTKVQQALAANVAEGADYEAFKDAVLEEVEPDTFLSEGHLEVVFRTNVQSAFSDGQLAILQHPVIRGGFPYASYEPIDDDRVRDEHLALERHGIDGTNVYRIDDPVFETFRPPWDYNCRCSWTVLTVRQAADRGVSEAVRWLESGVEPSPPAFVKMPPFRPPPGFVRPALALSCESLVEYLPGVELSQWQRGPQVGQTSDGQPVYRWYNPQTGQSSRQHTEPGTRKPAAPQEPAAQQRPAQSAPQQQKAPVQPARQPSQQQKAPAPAPAAPARQPQPPRQEKPQSPASPSARPPANQQQILSKVHREAHERLLNDAMGELQGVELKARGIQVPPEVASRFDAHGTSTLANLTQLLNGGIDPSREFYSSPLTGAYAAQGGYGVTVRDSSSFVVLGHPDQTLKQGGMAAVMVDPLHEPNIPDLQQAFPGVKFFAARQAPQVLAKVVAPAQRRMSLADLFAPAAVVGPAEPPEEPGPFRVVRKKRKYVHEGVPCPSASTTAASPPAPATDSGNPASG